MGNPFNDTDDARVDAFFYYDETKKRLLHLGLHYGVNSLADIRNLKDYAARRATKFFRKFRNPKEEMIISMRMSGPSKGSSPEPRAVADNDSSVSDDEDSDTEEQDKEYVLRIHINTGASQMLFEEQRTVKISTHHGRVCNVKAIHGVHLDVLIDMLTCISDGREHTDLLHCHIDMCRNCPFLYLPQESSCSTSGCPNCAAKLGCDCHTTSHLIQIDDENEALRVHIYENNEIAFENLFWIRIDELIKILKCVKYDKEYDGKARVVFGLWKSLACPSCSKPYGRQIINHVWTGRLAETWKIPFYDQDLERLPNCSYCSEQPYF